MDESTVVTHVARYLASSGGRVWYNRRGLQALPIATHEVAIGGWYPDLLCLGADDRVVAVEAKRGGDDLRLLARGRAADPIRPVAGSITPAELQAVQRFQAQRMVEPASRVSLEDRQAPSQP